MVRTGYGIRSRLKPAILIAATSLVLLMLLEGASSAIILLYDFTATRIENVIDNVGARYSRFDEFLGWTNIPGTDIPDMYGDGRYLRINARGLRNDAEIEKEVPPGRVRAVCSGDSFTFGQGVANDRTWCEQLARVDPRIQAVNMGQPGYGVDQAYLWYMRDGSVLDHDLHFFAFIEADFTRLTLRRLNGYPKPYLQLVDGNLVPDNVPISRIRLYRPWMYDLGRIAANLRVVEVVNRAFPETQAAAARRKAHMEDRLAVASKLLRTLKQVNEVKGSRLFLVYLPVHEDAQRGRLHWNRWVAAEAARLGVPFVDLAAALRGLPPEEVDRFFIPRNSRDHRRGDGHYTEEGHAWVAETLWVEADLASRID